MRRDFSAGYESLLNQARDLAARLEENRPEILELVAGRRTLPHGIEKPAEAAAAAFEPLRVAAADLAATAERLADLLRTASQG